MGRNEAVSPAWPLGGPVVIWFEHRRKEFLSVEERELTFIFTLLPALADASSLQETRAEGKYGSESVTCFQTKTPPPINK